MGNFYSMSQKNDSKPSSINDMVDYIASYYILTMDFKNLKNLLEKKYCDKLVILTADIMEKHLTKVDIEYLERKISKDNEDNGESIVNKEVVFLNKEDVDKLDIQDPQNKQRACIGIAKFYIKIAHLFASIVTTINPVYSYRDDVGNIVQVPLYEKHKIPVDKEPTLHTMGLCENRIASLQGHSANTNDLKEEIVQPTVCSVNMSMNGELKSLTDEPGIPELMYLYYDDEYDYKTGKFMGMSPTTREAYKADVAQFYTRFTGKDVVPEEVKEFKDIKLKDYNKNPYCSQANANKKYFKNDKDFDNQVRRDLFVKYAENLKSMIYKTNKNQEELLKIINKLFAYSSDPVTNARKIRVNPELTGASLQDTVEETRGLIIQLYLTCEADYAEGIKIFEAIVESTIIRTTENQINNLTPAMEKLYQPISDNVTKVDNANQNIRANSPK